MMLGIVGLPKQCLFLDPKTLTAPTEFTTTPFGTASAGSSPPSSETFATPEIDRNGGPLQRNSAPESHHASQSMEECFLYLETANSGFPFFVFSRICSSDFFTSGNEQYSSDIAHCKIFNTTFGAMIIGCLSCEATFMTYSICCTIGTVITFLSPAFSRVTTSNKPI